MGDPVRRSAKYGGHDAPYQAAFGDVSKIIDAARESDARSVNVAMTARYRLIGWLIVEFDQSGGDRAEYGAALIERLAEDLTERLGRCFFSQNIYNVCLFYLSRHSNRLTVLRAHRPIEERGRHADQGKESKFRRPSLDRGANQGALRARVPRPQGRVFGERPRRGAGLPSGDLPTRAGRRLPLGTQTWLHAQSQLNTSPSRAGESPTDKDHSDHTWDVRLSRGRLAKERMRMS